MVLVRVALAAAAAGMLGGCGAAPEGSEPTGGADDAVATARPAELAPQYDGPGDDATRSPFGVALCNALLGSCIAASGGDATAQAQCAMDYNVCVSGGVRSVPLPPTAPDP